jgi:hypothetical protein
MTARGVTRVRSAADLAALTPRQAEARLRAASALNEMRKYPRLGLRAAATREHTTPDTVRTFFGHLLDKERGRYRAAGSDREPFALDVTGKDGAITRVVRGSHVRRLNQDHHRALERFISADGGDVALLTPYEGKRVGGVVLLTDPDEIERLAVAGEFDWIDYSSF